MTPTGTVTAEKAGDVVTLTMRVTASDFVDLCAGLAWVDVLGGWGAWRTVLPVGDQPARIAGQFNLRRTYEPPTAASTETGAREGPAGAGAPSVTSGCRGCRDAGAGAAAVEQPAAAVAVAPNGVPESASALWAEVRAAFEMDVNIDPRDVPTVLDYYRPLGDPDE